MISIAPVVTRTEKLLRKTLVHRFRVGQSVDLMPRVIRQAAKGSYEIIRLMPENENDPQYCVKSAAERYERVVPESELELSTSSESVPSASGQQTSRG